jgi:hypothetical protein
MNELFSIEAEVTFIPKAEGWRETIPTLSGCVYRPHIVLGDPNQRQSIIDGNEIKETYLGVAFKSSLSNVEFNKPCIAEIVFIYYPQQAIYDSLVANATFTIREGARIVGFGRVKRLPNQKPHS